MYRPDECFNETNSLLEILGLATAFDLDEKVIYHVFSPTCSSDTTIFLSRVVTVGFKGGLVLSPELKSRS
jgi:hypothetical protein